MNGGIIEKTLLLKDIEQIDLYYNEENKILEKLSKTFNDTMEEYESSDNSHLMLAEIDKLNNQTTELYEKRKRYTYVLNRVIEQYEYLTNRTKERFTVDTYDFISKETMNKYGGDK